VDRRTVEAIDTEAVFQALDELPSVVDREIATRRLGLDGRPPARLKDIARELGLPLATVGRRATWTIEVIADRARKNPESGRATSMMRETIDESGPDRPPSGSLGYGPGRSR
jgi:hypothetical protein